MLRICLLFLGCMLFTDSFASEKLCAIGDTGTADKGQLSVARALEKENCRKILLAGDIIYSFGLRNANDKKFFTHFYNPYKKLIEEQKVEFYLVAGNHDWSFTGTAKAWVDLSAKYPWLHYPHYYYTTILDQQTCLVALDTEKYYQNQINWFVQQRPKIKGCTFSIAFGHRPYLSSGSHGNASGEAKRLLDETIMGVVDLYIAGHDHQLSDEGDKLHTKLLVSGAGGKWKSLATKPVKWGIAAFGYVVIEINDSVATYTFKRVVGDKVDTVYSDIILGQGIR